ncbi:signal peptidase complex subunit 3A-like [Silene latifolia]|uniref:signal peptidase complex subunit 3A-like n=1 Tax=Silene latifolia TaxID=37657 RepID=UPI003D78A554
MHSIGYRANSLLTLAVTILAFLCIFASFSDTLSRPNPTVDIKVVSFDGFMKSKDGDDGVSMTLKVEANLSSLFTWNTKQVFAFVAAEYETPQNSVNQISVWDHIIESKKDADIQVTFRNKYPIFDQGSNLRGTEFNLTLHWHVMPKTGMMFTGLSIIPGHRFPDKYI